jgi:hypothetical protein
MPSDHGAWRHPKNEGSAKRLIVPSFLSPLPEGEGQ